MKKIVEVNFERIVPEGRAVGKVGEQSIYAIGALPGEKCTVEIFRDKKRFAEGKIVKVLDKSIHRVEPVEDHYMSCSPWQAVEYDYQIELKSGILQKCFSNMAHQEIEIKKFWKSEELYGYRTKIEYSFTEIEGKIKLAFYERDSFHMKLVLEKGCLLGSDNMNKAALVAVEYINTLDIRISSLKGLTVRESKTNGQIQVILILSQNITEEIMTSLTKIELENFIVVFSSSEFSGRNFDRMLYQKGSDFLEENIAGLKIRYPYDGFFQNNLDGFAEVLKDIKSNITKCERIVELYSGVGTIGLSLCALAENVYGVEIVDSAVDYSEVNKKLNGITNYLAMSANAEWAQKEIISSADVFVLDPPRSGLQKRVIDMMREFQPKTIIYLSCNPITQARDYELLKDLYEVTLLNGYDFYPNTVHLESLLALKLKSN